MKPLLKDLSYPLLYLLALPIALLLSPFFIALWVWGAYKGKFETGDFDKDFR